MRSKSLLYLSFVIFAIGQFIFFSEHLKPLLSQISIQIESPNSTVLQKLPLEIKLSVLYLSTVLMSLACILFNFLCPPIIKSSESRHTYLLNIADITLDERNANRTRRLFDENISWGHRDTVERHYGTMIDQLHAAPNEESDISKQRIKMQHYLEAEIDKSPLIAPLISIIAAVGILLTFALSLYEVARVLEYIYRILFNFLGMQNDQ